MEQTKQKRQLPWNKEWWWLDNGKLYPLCFFIDVFSSTFFFCKTKVKIIDIQSIQNTKQTKKMIFVVVCVWINE